MVTIEQAMRLANASLMIEGMRVSKKQETLIKRRLKGEISEPEFRNLVLENIKNDEI